MESVESSTKATTSAEPCPQAIPAIPKKAPVISKESPNLKEMELIMLKVQPRLHKIPPYNIVDIMKKENITMSIWDSLSIPG